MGLALWVGALLVLLTFAQRLHAQIDATATWAAIWLGGALVILGFAVPDPWIGMLLAWVGLQVPWTQLIHRWGIRPIASFFDILIGQAAFLMGGATYLGLSRTTANLLPVLAGTAVVWGLVNVGGAIWSKRTGKLPGRVTEMPGWPESAWLGNNYSLSWLCGLGLLSACYLGGVWLLCIPLLIPGIYLSQNMTGLFSGWGALLLYVGLVWGWTTGLLTATFSLSLGCALYPRVRGALGQSFRARWALWKHLGKHLTWSGRGLNFMNVLGEVRLPETGLKTFWDRAHNEWLQGFLELGPLAPLLAAAYLVQHLLGLPSGPNPAYALSLVVLTAIHALTYFPLHIPGHAFPLLVGMAVLDRGL